eukprot:CCRYP_002434-RA/>CCRYP_002434-RA protein AED:0.07 eAED:0.07 QI:141/0.85/0.87/1/1/1/8/45/929
MTTSDDPTEMERTIGDWTAYQDDEGRTYYYNNKTEESTWDPPPGFEDDVVALDAVVDSPASHDVVVNVGEGQDQAPTPRQEDDNDGITRSPGMEDLGDDDDGITRSPTLDEQGNPDDDDVADGEEIGDGWIAYKDDEGRVYYYNSESGETQWDKPDLTSVSKTTEETKTELAAKPDDSGDYMDASPTASDREDDGDEAAKQEETKTDAVDQQQKYDPATVAENFLKEPDAVMESHVLDHISTLVTAVGPQEAGRKVMQSLINGYQGDTAMCGLMGLWLAELKASSVAFHKKAKVNAGPPAANPVLDKGIETEWFNQGADAARYVVEEVVNRLAKERFTKDGGDAIMSLSKKQVAFVDAMIESERWRNLLIDLSASNTDNKLFMYCLQSISNLGHHRAIANRINQSDYFGVLNEMLFAELTLLGKIAVDGYSKHVAESIDTSKGRMGTLIADLRRTCTSTSYTYLYTNEIENCFANIFCVLRPEKLLHELIYQSANQVAKCSADANGLMRAAKKWRRLQEELEDEMLKTQTTGTTFQRKRRVDVTLAMGDLVQRQRRRINPTEPKNELETSYGSSKILLANNLDTAMATFLTRCSLGNPIDKESVENIFKYAYGGSTDRIGDLLIKHPLAITFLLRNMFGTKRIRQLDTRQKCARLLALSVIASERITRSENKSDTLISDEDVLCQILLKASHLCEQVEAMVSFTVLDNVEATDGSVGRQLSAMCIKYSVVAEGALIWAKELALGSEFVTTAGYPTLSPCVLSLARLICIHHPLSRPAVLDVSLIFMSHSNREISHQKMQSIKEQCLRLMIWLSTQGMALSVICAVREKLEKGSSEMDSALVRYFMSCLLETVQPPFSLPFIRTLSGMLLERPCIDTLTSQLFDDHKRSQLSQLIVQFEEAFTAKNVTPSKEDELVLSTLKTYYAPTAVP